MMSNGVSVVFSPWGLTLGVTCSMAVSGGCRSTPPADAQSDAVADTPDSDAGPDDFGRWALVKALASDDLAGRAPGTDGAAKARGLIRARLEACGYRVTEQAVPPTGVNLLAERPDAERVARRVLLSAHYDHLGVIGGQVMNGADDNAAAVGAVVEVACRTPFDAHAPVALLVALWDTEEPPFFMTPAMGSAHFVGSPTVPLASIDVSIVLDLVGGGLWDGFPFHFVLGAETAPTLPGIIAATPAPEGLTVVDAGLHLVEDLVATGSHQPWSDYHAFRMAGVPVLFLSNGQSEHYHTPADDFSTLNLAALGRQTDWLVDLVGRLLAAPEKPVFSTARVRPTTDLAATRVLLQAAIAAAPKVPRLDAGSLQAALDALDPEAPETLRRGVQRLQCLASGRYPAAACAAF